MHHFQSSHKEFDGFSDFYHDQVFPELIAREGARKRAVKKGLTFGLITVAILLGIAAYVFLQFGNVAVAVFIAFLALMGGPGAFALATQSIRDEVKDKIVQAIVGYVGWNFVSDVSDYDLSAFKALFLLPQRYHRSAFEDRLSGHAHGADFHSVEAHLEKRETDSEGKETWKTVFRGQLMVFDFPTKTFGRTVVLRDKGWFNRKTKSDMKRIGLADPVFEKIFEAYGTDQVESRVILDPAVMQRIVDLEAAISGKNIQFGFDEDRLYISVETGDQFEAGSMFHSLAKPDRAQKILDEVGAIYDVSDAMTKPKR